MADLSVQIGADISAYKAAMTAAGQTAQQTADQIRNALNNANKNVDSLGNSAQSASMKFMQMRSGMSAARDGALAFVVGGQRADMMLMAMTHHINSLVNETGSLGGAFKSMGNSLLGVGGVLLALTLAFEVYEKTTKKAKDTTVDYVSTLNSVRQATLKGQQDGQTEITRLQVLYKATQDHTLSLKDRNLAYDELEKKYPQFFTNAEREKTLLGENAKGYTALANAILAAAMAKAYEAQIGLNSNRIFEDQNKGNDLLVKQAALQKEVANAQKNIAESNKYVGGNGQAGNSYDPAVLARSTLELEKNKKAVEDLNADITKLNADNAKLSNLSLGAEQKAGFKTTPEDSSKTPKDAKTELAQLEEQLRKLQSAEDDVILKGHVPDLLNPTKLEHSIEQLTAVIAHVKELNSEIGNFHGEAKSLSFTGNKGADSVANVQTTGMDVDKGNIDDLQKMAKAYIALNQEKNRSLALSKQYNDENKEDAKTLKDLTRTIGQGLMNAFELALSGQESFLSAFGGFIVKLIEKLIAAAIAAAALAALLSLTGFGVAMGASAGFGSLFGTLSGLGGITAHAQGGIFTQPTIGMFGEAGAEAIVTPKHLQDFAGTSGGSQHITIEPMMIGSDLFYKQRVRSDKYVGRTK